MAGAVGWSWVALLLQLLLRASLGASVAEVTPFEARIKWNSTDLIVGDWSTTYLSCPCCAAVLQAVNPALKVIIMLRDPVKRALSRFIEQQRNAEFIMHHQVGIVGWSAYPPFLENYMAHFPPSQLLVLYTEDMALRPLETIKRTESFLQAPPFEYEQSMVTSVYNSRECYARIKYQRTDLILGDWSTTYLSCPCCAAVLRMLNPALKVIIMLRDPVKRALSRFIEQQRNAEFIMHHQDMALRPLETIKRREGFLQAPPHEYEPSMVTSVYNSRECYHWQCSRNKTDIRPLPEEGTLGHAVMRLVDFYRPHMQRLIGWADQGKIGQVPASWRNTYR
ncbi:hypothetical protein TSOC_003734 [Tetrabaena socialis]|uniref:Sulfotransferase n=1 Tax=Tetrabaena socialis TaxID=47790 RepID=A0A2J8AAU3_9CHLO|nr:hypothetical protein TSOC_003734 [Tetrabaena socialis]|eukprot:PNH09649.1 hypothetical protein TSOC_003734 [Tetrabaena socialis]